MSIENFIFLIIGVVNRILFGGDGFVPRHDGGEFYLFFYPLKYDAPLISTIPALVNSSPSLA
jgi:hypothetical protein